MPLAGIALPAVGDVVIETVGDEVGDTGASVGVVVGRGVGAREGLTGAEEQASMGPVLSQIQVLKDATRVYTPGKPSRAHPIPQLTIPAITDLLSSRLPKKGPPLSP